MNIATLTSLLFCIGLYGVLTRCDVVAVLASVEIMLGAANVQLVASASALTPGLHGVGQTLGIVVLVLAAAEAAVGMALLVTIVRRWDRRRVDSLTEVDG